MLMLDRNTQAQIEPYIDELVRTPITKIPKLMLKLIADAYQSPVVVAHYDLTDPGLENYLAGVASR